MLLNKALGFAGGEALDVASLLGEGFGLVLTPLLHQELLLGNQGRGCLKSGVESFNLGGGALQLLCSSGKALLLLLELLVFLHFLFVIVFLGLSVLRVMLSKSALESSQGANLSVELSLLLLLQPLHGRELVLRG